MQPLAKTTSPPLATEIVKNVDFTVIDATYSDTTIDITIYAKSMQSDVSLIMEAAEFDDVAYEKAGRYGTQVWGVECDAVVNNIRETQQSLWAERDGANLLLHLTISLPPDNLPQMYDINLWCAVFESNPFSSPAETANLEFSIPQSND